MGSKASSVNFTTEIRGADTRSMTLNPLCGKGGVDYMPYDLFISYSRRDNSQSRVNELKERIEEDYRAFAGEELVCFFDTEAIHGMDDWQHRILAGLRESSLLLLVLSPAYLDSPHCEWEIVEYLKYEHTRAAQGQGVAPVYFESVPGLDSPAFGSIHITSLWLI